MIQAGKDKIAVAIDGEFYENRIGNIHIDPLYNPTRYIKTQAQVVGLPFKVHQDYQDFIDRMATHESAGTTMYLYFDYKALEEDEFAQLPDGRRIYFVPIELVYAYATNIETPEKDVFPNTGIVLCKPWYGFGYEEIEVAGVKMIAKTSSLIVTDINPREDERIAEIAYAGDVYADFFEQNISKGDLVFREAHTNYDYEIAGEKLFIVRLENIDGVLLGKDFSYSAEDRDEETTKYDVDATQSMKNALEMNEVLSREKKTFAFS